MKTKHCKPEKAHLQQELLVPSLIFPARVPNTGKTPETAETARSVTAAACPRSPSLVRVRACVVRAICHHGNSTTHESLGPSPLLPPGLAGDRIKPRPTRPTCPTMSRPQCELQAMQVGGNSYVSVDGDIRVGPACLPQVARPRLQGDARVSYLLYSKRRFDG
eukprot:9471752-Pyramimonas_sp.AAC.1